jgi:molybdate transport system permease protein
VIFHWSGAVLASATVALPLLVRTSRSALEGVAPGYLEAGATCGAGPGRVFFTIHLPLAMPGIAAGLTLAFARALGEFGATLLVAGNIPGKTQTLPLAIYEAVFAGDYARANRMVLFVTALALVLLFLADGLQRKTLAAKPDRG